MGLGEERASDWLIQIRAEDGSSWVVLQLEFININNNVR